MRLKKAGIRNGYLYGNIRVLAELDPAAESSPKLFSESCFVCFKLCFELFATVKSARTDMKHRG